MKSGPIVGRLDASGRSVDEIIADAMKQIKRVAGDHTTKITRIDIQPLLTTDGGEIPLWAANVEFEVLAPQ